MGIVNIEAQASGLPTIVSDRVPDDIMVTKLVKYIKLSDNDYIWGKTIIDTRINNNRSNIRFLNDIKKSGYDITIEARKLENLYYNLICEENSNE